MKRTFAILLVVMALAVACHTDVKSLSTKSDGRTFEQRLYALDIGEAYRPSDNETFLRVPGGWVYHRRSGYGTAATFVPFADGGSR